MTRPPEVAVLYAQVGDSRVERTLRGPTDVVVIGRGSAASWRVDEPLLSRRHLQIEWKNGELRAEDLGSRNGSRINGAPLCGATRLAHGDTLAIGAMRIDVTIPGARDDRTVGRPPHRDVTQPTGIAPGIASGSPHLAAQTTRGRARTPRRALGAALAMAAGGALGSAAPWPDDHPPRVDVRATQGAPGRVAPTPGAAGASARAATRPLAPAAPTPTARRDAVRLLAAGRRVEAVRLLEQVRAGGDADPAVDLAIRVLLR